MVKLDQAESLAVRQAADLMALDDALTGLAAIDQRKAQVVELRYFGGMSVKETAEALGVSEVTVMRDWRAAKAWLFRTISHGEGAPNSSDGMTENKKLFRLKR